MGVFCFLCEKVFSNQSNINKHMRYVHNKQSSSIIDYEGGVGLYKCLNGCNVSFKCNEDLRNHLQQKHSVYQEILTPTFTSYNDFTSWLKLEEEQHNIRYFRSTGIKKGGGNSCRRVYFNCSRSGQYKCKKSYQDTKKYRNKKSQGSCKINRYCTSQIIVKILEDSSCQVKYFKTHYGHEQELQHIRISKQKREETASKLISGVSSERILDLTRDHIQKDLKRDDLITMKDINNIKHSFNIQLQSGCRHKDDPVSVDLWIEELKEAKHNPVLYYKKQNHLCEIYNLALQDMVLIFMTKTQSDILTQFGNKIICVDSTHGLNAYNFEMTTILIIDEYGNGFPCSFMFTNRMDSFVHAIFFTEIKKIVGEIHTEYFMSDITSIFYTPWQEVMVPAKSQLFCSWHIDRAWQQNLSKISDKGTKQWAYKTLKYIQTILDETQFKTDLENFINLLYSKEDTRLFAIYLRNNYLKNITQWAYCYRKHCVANTNMHLESMHKTIKYIYLKGKKVKRLDKTLHALQKFVRDKTIERILKLTKNSNHSHGNLINKGHRVALSLNLSDITINTISEEDNTFHEVKIKDNMHIVTKKQTNTCCNLICKICNICIHTYECTCINYNLKLTICEHIHIICLHSETHKHVLKEHCKNLEIEQLVDGLQKNPNNRIQNTTKLEEEIICLSQQIIDKVINRNLGIEELEFIKSNLKVAVAVGSMEVSGKEKCFLNKDGIQAENSPANKNNEKQCYFSTKKQKAKGVYRQKPSSKEIQIIKDTLNNSLFISENIEHDHQYY